MIFIIFYLFMGNSECFFCKDKNNLNNITQSSLMVKKQPESVEIRKESEYSPRQERPTKIKKRMKIEDFD